jgi:hypothetical protein
MSRHGLLHNARNKKIYDSWKRMMERCNNPKDKDYRRYGAKGISVTQRWHSFPLFFEDMEPAYFPKATLDRIDNASPYSSENCRWATRAQQSNNRGAFLRRVTIGGVTKNVTEWSRHYNIRTGTVFKRIYSGWSPLKALTVPVHRSY